MSCRYLSKLWGSLALSTLFTLLSAAALAYGQTPAPAATPSVPAPASPSPSATPPGATPPSTPSSAPSVTPSVTTPPLGSPTAGALPAGAQTPQPQITPASAPTAPLSLTDVIDRAKGNEATFAAAVANSRIANLDRSIARAGLLPSAIYHNQILYTQGIHGTTASSGASVGSPAVTSNPIFIANNSVHEYTSQASVTETLGLAQYAAVSRAVAASAVAAAELEVARRGLVSTVVGLYYGSLSSERKLAVAQRAAAEAAGFTTLTQQREAAREGAHADVVKAQLQQQQRDRDLADAQLQVARSRLELGVLLFADPRTTYTLAGPVAPPAAR